MFNTRNYVLEGSDVPSTWVFEYYLDLPESLTGQDVKIKSIFNPTERTPSFCIYVDKSIMQYKFKDFSTGKSGNKVDLVKSLFNLEYTDAMNKIVEEYNKYVKSSEYKKNKIVPQERWKVDIVVKRQWNTNDREYWLPFNIGTKLLTEYNIKPVDYYNLIKEDQGEIKKLKIQNSVCYGYFDKAGEVYKLYQPNSKKHKFFKVKPYLQGYDQLQYKQPHLVICSSLKDALCLKSIGYNIEVIAPDSENTMIKPHVIHYLKRKYRNVITFFDNDDAGIKAVDRYTKLYNINGLVSPLSKDISDAVRDHGVDKVHKSLKPLLINLLKK